MYYSSKSDLRVIYLNGMFYERDIRHGCMMIYHGFGWLDTNHKHVGRDH